MRRSAYMVVGAVLIGVPAWAIGAQGPAEATGQQATVTVNVSAQCVGSTVSISIAPWDAVVRRGDQLQWTHAGVDSLDITPLNAWPFPSPPTRGKGNVPARAGTVPANAPVGRRFPYEVVLFCGERRIVIDPDVVIGDN